MRQIFDFQMKLGEKSIESIQFDPRSRDEIPKLLKGLQTIYCEKELRKQVFDILKELVPDNVDTKKGRKGMDLWKILVLGTMRNNCNWDYDKLQEMANNHIQLRQMLGHGAMDDNLYALQTLKDNITLFTPSISDKINQIVVNYGHKIAGKKKLKI